MRSVPMLDERILVLAPPDATREVLEALEADETLAAEILPDVHHLEAMLPEGVGVLIAAVPAGDDQLAALAAVLGTQPDWSDLPLVLLATDVDAHRIEQALRHLGDVPVLERPLSAAALLRAVRTGLRVRRHQYRLRHEITPRAADGFRTFFELPVVGAAQVDPATFRFIRVNRRFCEITGYGEAELLGMRVQDVTHPDDHALDALTLGGVVRGERDAWTIEKRYVRRDGQVKWVHVAGQLLRDAQGRPALTVATIVDIDERIRLAEAWRRREQELRESEGRFRRLADAAPVLIWQAGPDKQCTWFNQRWLRFTGRTLEAELGSGWLASVHPADAPRCMRTYTEAFDARAPFEMEYRLRRHDGQWRWVVDHGEPLYTPAGDFTGYIGSCHDITDRREAEQALRRSDEFHSIIAELASDFAFTARVEPDGTMVTDAVTEGFARVLGWTPEELMREGGWAATVHPEDREEATRRLARLMAGETIGGVLRQYTRDGRSIWVQYRTRPVRDANGRVVRVYGASRDITAQYEMQQAIAESDRRKDEFLATLAHELRNPLAPLRNALYLLRVSEGGEAAPGALLAMMERQVGVLVRLVDDLLEISRISRGKITLHRERFRLVEAVMSAVETVRPMVDAGGHDLMLALPDEAVWVHGDRVRLSQVIANLLSNAAKYTPGRGHIALTAGAEGDEAVVRVRDDGLGIPPGDLDRIFELFVQVDQSRARAQGGLGIGLTLARKIVGLHGGTVAARSGGPGRGSEFEVRLPRVREEPAGADRPAPPTEGAWASRRVLIVDDNADAADTLALLLRRLGMTVSVARGGAHALAMLEDERPEVVLLDIGMPGMDGYEVATRIRGTAGFERVRIFALSGYGHSADRRRSREAGFDGHLVKPVKLEQLRALLGVRAGV